MSTLLNVAMHVLIGAVSGVAGGAIGGMAGAFYHGYSISWMFARPQRFLTARVNVVMGARIGGIFGLLIGGITGGSGSLFAGLLVAGALVTTLYMQIRKDVGKPIALVILTLGCGGLGAALAGYAGTMIARGLLQESPASASEAPVMHFFREAIERVGALAHEMLARAGTSVLGMAERVSASTAEIAAYVASLSLLLLLIAWVVDRRRFSRTSRRSRFSPQLMSPTAANAFFGLLIGLPLFIYTRSHWAIVMLAWGAASAFKLITGREGSSGRPEEPKE